MPKNAQCYKVLSNKCLKKKVKKTKPTFLAIPKN